MKIGRVTEWRNRSKELSAEKEQLKELVNGVEQKSAKAVYKFAVST